MPASISLTVRCSIAAVLIIGAARLAWAIGPDAAEQAEITALRSASIAPAAAITAAEARAGGHALAFGYEKNARTNAYEVTVSGPSGLSLVQIDPKSGDVLHLAAQPADAIAGDGLPASAVSAAANARMSLAGAVSVAEQQAPGRALEANYLMRQGRMAVDVEVATDKGGLNHVMVDPATSQIVQTAAPGTVPGAGGAADQEKSGGQDSD